MRIGTWVAAGLVVLAGLPLATRRCAGATGIGFPAAQRVLFETGFEPFEGYDNTKDLGGQNGWMEIGSGGNGLLPGPIEGFQGQVAYIGFAPPTGAEDQLNVFRPVALVPVGNDEPLITFTVSFQIYDSTTAAPYFDDFRWSAYNTSEQRLFTLDLDNSTLAINFALDDGMGFKPTGYNFLANTPYDLRITLNFARNLWTADVNGAVVVNAQPISTKQQKLDLNEIDAVWVVRTPGKPGDNFMIFDDYSLSVLPVSDIPSSIELAGSLTAGPVMLRVLGEPGVTYAVDYTTDLDQWIEVGRGLAQSPAGMAEIQDASPARGDVRFYRARSVVP